MTPEQATEILIEAHARVQALSLVLTTALFSAFCAIAIALVWRWVGRADRINFYRARDAEARELVEHSIETINRLAHHGRKQINLLRDVDAYFREHRATFDDKERDPLAARIVEVLAEFQPPLQITYDRRRPPQREAA